MTFTLQDLASRTGAVVEGDPACVINGLSTPDKAQRGELCFAINKKMLADLANCKASAVILAAAEKDMFGGNVLVHENPYYVYAVASQYFSPYPPAKQGVHPSASVHNAATIGKGVSIAAGAVIDEHAVIGGNCEIGAGVYIGPDSEIGDETRIRANAVVHSRTQIGKRCLVHSGAVIGDDGFGFAPHEGHWERIEQIGNVIIGDDVDVGCNTTIDRAALHITRIGNGVKIDNLVQIAHNVIIGDHTAIAGCVGIAGSSIIGKACKIGGGVGIAGHVEIADGVTVTGMSMVTNNLTQAGGVYSSGTSVVETRLWRRNAVRFNHLDEMARKIQELERQLNELSDNKNGRD